MQILSESYFQLSIKIIKSQFFFFLHSTKATLSKTLFASFEQVLHEKNQIPWRFVEKQIALGIVLDHDQIDLSLINDEGTRVRSQCVV